MSIELHAFRLRFDKYIETQKQIVRELKRLNYTLYRIDRTMETLTEALIDLTKKENVEGEDAV